MMGMMVLRWSAEDLPGEDMRAGDWRREGSGPGLKG